jgi:DNA-binding PadR family transcriptional regulator
MHAHTYPLHPRAGRWFASFGAGHGPRGRRGRRGPGPHGFGGFPGPRGPRARRGDIRAALLVLLAEEPRNGYQLMQEIERRSDGIWRPSPGSVYPALQQLEDEGLVATGERDGRRVYELTDAGRAQIAERDEHAPAPWDAVKEDVGPGPWQLIQLAREVGMAAAQLVHAGDDAQLAQAQDVLRETRRSLYRILAEDSPADPADGPAPEEV